MNFPHNEIRLDEKGQLDDIAIENVHLEDMDGKNWWLGIYNKKTGERTTFMIGSKTKITVRLIENGLGSKEVPWQDPGKL